LEQYLEYTSRNGLLALSSSALYGVPELPFY